MSSVSTSRRSGQLWLHILQHDVHRLDNAMDGTPENVMSTLRYFILRVGIFEGDGATPTDAEDGLRLKATLVYEQNGSRVEELSATLEPPLLGGEAIIDHGIAAFKLRITVLSSLCRGNRFRVQVTCAERSDFDVYTAPIRTITKLRRPPGKKAAAKAAAAAMGESGPRCELESFLLDDLEEECGLVPGDTSAKPQAAIGESGPSGELESFLLNDLEEECGLVPGGTSAKRTLDDLWSRVQENRSLLLSLQQEQQELFREIRDLRQKLVAPTDAPVVHSTSDSCVPASLAHSR
jgi:hypothetical protein